jgi:hypothetical protein
LGSSGASRLASLAVSMACLWVAWQRASVAVRRAGGRVGRQ